MKLVKQFDIIDSLRSFFKIQPFMPIMEWIDKNITLVDDVSSEADKPDFTQYPYQVEILKQWEDLSCRKHVVIMSCEQLRGKTTMFLYGLLWRMVYDPCQMLICYPSDDKAIETNQTKFEPLVSHISGLKEELAKPRAKRRRSLPL